MHNMPIKNPSARRPLWSSTQKFRVCRIVDLCLQFCQAEERERDAAARRGRIEGGGRETAVPTRRYEGMDLDLKGGTTWKEGAEGSEVGWAISEPSVAQWLTGAIQPTASLPSPLFLPLLPLVILSPSTYGSYIYVYSCALLSWQEKPTRVTPN